MSKWLYISEWFGQETLQCFSQIPSFSFCYLVNRNHLYDQMLDWLVLWTDFKHENIHQRSVHHYNRPIHYTPIHTRFSIISCFSFFLYSTVWRYNKKVWTFDLFHGMIWNFNSVCALIFLSLSCNFVMWYLN